MAQVTFSGVKKTYPNGVEAVSNFSQTIEDGSFAVFVGPSGSGKSTALRMIAGLEEITDGTLSIGGQVVNDVPPAKRDIGMVFQNYALYPHMTVFENIAFPLTLRKLPKVEIKRKVNEVAKILEITQLLGRHPGALSGGERQRVALGRALVRSPRVILFDEPLSNLDARLRATMRAEIKRLHQKLGRTFIYVTHDQTEALTMGDKVVILKDGKLQQAAAPLTVFQKPANEFVATFIGTPQMNILPATLHEKNGTYTATLEEGTQLPLPDAIGKSEAIQAYIGQPLHLGIRPTDIRVTPPNGGTTMTITHKEILGATVQLHLTHGTLKLIAVVEGESAWQTGDTVEITPAENAIHLFHAETGQALDFKD